MEWDLSRVYTAVNADEVKVGSKVICAFTVNDLRLYVEEPEGNIMEVLGIYNTSVGDRFLCNFQGESMSYPLCYLISEPEEKVLKWTDLKIGDVIRAKDGSVERLVTGVIQNGGDFNIHIEAGSTALSDKNLELWEKVE